MNHYQTFYLILLLLLPSFSNTKAEMLIDSAFFSFEADAIDGITGTWTTKDQYVKSSEQAATGIYSMKVDLAANIANNVQTTSPRGSVKLSGGEEYTISMQVLIPTETSISGITFMVGATLKIENLIFSEYAITNDGTWQNLTFNYIPEGDMLLDARLGFRALKNLDQSGVFYIDDIRIEGAEVDGGGDTGGGDTGGGDTIATDTLATLWTVPDGDPIVKPNILIVMTDEHTIRTIGAHRDQLPEEMAYLWGRNNVVATPNLDKLASEGAIATKYYASSPVCTPSRGSFVTGLFPYTHGAPKNDMQMHTNVVTFGEYFKQKGYNTSYIGKWHLNAVTDDNVNDYAIEPSFGFDDNTYMYHKAHPKWAEYIDRDLKGKDVEFKVVPYSQVPGQLPAEGQDLVYYTEFVANNAIKIMDEVKDSAEPFCMMVSIPDPHTPDVCHANYYNKYKDMPFEAPLSHKMPEELKPKWANGTSKLDRREFDAEARDDMAQYFAMVDFIDEQMGRLMTYLDDNNLRNNTIVVFTADHGDMLFEHQRIDKGVAYEASAVIPFIIRYPNVISAGKVVTTPQVNVDFMPTLLGLVGAPAMEGIHGEDCSDLYTNDASGDADRDIYMRFISGRIVTLVTQRYKLVLSNTERPWLFDLEKDPNEMVNYYDDPAYASIFTMMLDSVSKKGNRYGDPAYASVPANKQEVNITKVDVASVRVHNADSAMAVGETSDVYGVVSAADASDYASIKTIKWTSSHPLVATVDSTSPITGGVKALSGGITTITATSVDGEKVASYILTVEGEVAPVTEVVFEDDNVVVFPTVFENHLNVSFKGEHQYNTLLLYDITGKVCYRQDISGVPSLDLQASEVGAQYAGIYLIKLIGKERIFATKLIKK